MTDDIDQAAPIDPDAHLDDHPDMPDIPNTAEEALRARLAALTAKRAASAPGTSDGDTPKRRHRHAALGSRIATLVISISVTAGLVWQFSRFASAEATLPAGIVSRDPNGASVVDGDVYNNKYGPVQVEVTFAADGTITDVTAVATPTRDGKSVRINDRAVPRLNSSALAAQSATVDSVSGATYTSQDYQKSLQSAIDIARSAGIPA